MAKGLDGRSWGQTGRIDFLGRPAGGVIRPKRLWLGMLLSPARQKLPCAGGANRAGNDFITERLGRGRGAPGNKLGRIEIVTIQGNNHQQEAINQEPAPSYG